MKRFLGTVMLLSMTLGWWGFVYPELCLIPEECEQSEYEQETICIKSWLYEYICQHKEAAYER